MRDADDEELEAHDSSGEDPDDAEDADESEDEDEDDDDEDEDTDMNDDEGRAGPVGFVAGIVVGALVGAAVALLVAPGSGQHTRRRLRRGLGEVKGRAQDEWDHLRTKARKELKRRLASDQ